MAQESRLEGLDKALATMKALGPAISAKGMRFALRKGANLVADAARENVSRLDDSSTPEDIQKNIAVRFSNRTYKATGDVLFRVGVLGGARQYANTKRNVRAGRAGQSYATAGDKTNPGGDTWYWRFLEFGTERMPASPFMRPALSENVQAATDITGRELSKWLDRYLKRSAR